MQYGIEEIKDILKTRPARLDDIEQWLFVAVNTARSITDNSSKTALPNVFENCRSTAEIQREFDMIQGKYGREGFSQRKSPVYNYLCMLVAYFDDKELSPQERELITEYNSVDTYLLYELV